MKDKKDTSRTILVHFINFIKFILLCRQLDRDTSRDIIYLNI